MEKDKIESRLKKMKNISENVHKEHMSSIATHFIYVNSQNHIVKIKTEKLDLSSSNWLKEGEIVIPENVIFELIQSKKNLSIMGVEHKYSLLDIFLYNVDLEPENIQQYSNNLYFSDFSKKFFEKVSFSKEVVLYPSLFVFHSINSFFFIFKEKYDLFFHKKKNGSKKIVFEKKHNNITKKKKFDYHEKPLPFNHL